MSFRAAFNNVTLINETTITEEIRAWYPPFELFCLISYTFVFVLHICNLAMMIYITRIQTACSKLLISLSISDALLVLYSIVIVGIRKIMVMNIYRYCVYGFCYTASLFANVGLSVEKYIAVKYSLRYKTIVTKDNTIKAISLFWLVSAVLAVLPSVIAEVTKQLLCFHGVQYTLRFVGISILLACALYIRNSRNIHRKRAKRLHRYFDKPIKPSKHLGHIKSSMVDIIRLNVTTALVVVAETSTAAMWHYGVLKDNPVLFYASVVANAVYLISNPIIYILVIKNLRIEYKRIICHGKAKVKIRPGIQLG